jgi:type IX secretion system PorP/SprF family membrane protein
MRKSLLTYRFLYATVLLVYAALDVHAQQVPATDLYFNNLFFVNPAKAGDAPSTQLALFNRRQWTGIEGAPATSCISVDMPLKNNFGIGFNFSHDQINFLRNVKSSLAAKYKLQVAKDHYLSIGIQGSMYDAYLNFNNVKVDDYSDGILMLGNNNNAIALGVDLGLNYQFKKLELGVFHSQAFNNSAQAYFAKTLNAYRLMPHYGAYATYRFALKANLALQPRLGLRYLPGVFMQADLGAMLDWNSKFGLGLLYRTQESMSLSFKYKASDLITFYYSYGIGTQGIATYSGGTHEFLLLFTLKKEVPAEEVENRKIQLDSLDAAVKKLNDKTKVLDSINVALDARVKALEEMQVKYLDSLEILQMIKDQMHPKTKEDSALGALQIGERYVIENIHFEFNSYVIKDESKPILDNVVKYLGFYGRVELEVDGHTDFVGSNEANMILSFNRAKSVCAYLTQHGISTARLTYKGYGEIAPVATNETDEGRAKNRRIEFIVTAR